jgi:5-methylcytosine-specific restriction endonuclease McrA
LRERWAKRNHTLHETSLLELTRLALVLPAYIRFMYDLVEEQRLPVAPRRIQEIQERDVKRATASTEEIVYRTIKSIRVIRPGVEAGENTGGRKWTPPSYAFAVRGHWRHYPDSARCGHDRDGSVVLGKTWVTEYTKGEVDGLEVLSFPTSSETRTPNVVVGIKQPLSYARDVIASRRVEATRGTAGPARSEDDAVAAPGAPGHANDPSERRSSITGNGPSGEWMAAERAKLTAGLRYFVLKRDHFTCQLCGRKQAEENYVRLEVDHRTPVARWGRTVESNLWTLCRDCNQGKSAKPL